MASSLIRFRRSLSALSGLQRSFSATPVPPFSAPTHRKSTQSAPNPILQIQSRSFRSSSISLMSTRSSSASNIVDEIGPDTILFEGCDYNHWLFVIDFPKDNKPSPEEMVRVYEETCAKGLNISVEEAKKKMYACSTTTYTGFQAVMTEEESKKFEGLPGVIFVLPDSYIDPVNKQYGGDQYINGTIIPRPPPIQYGRNQGARRDRQRNPGQYDRQENPMSNPQGNFSYNNRGPMQGDGRNYGPPQNYPPQQNHGQAPQNFPPQQNYGQASQRYPPQQNYGQASQNYPPQQNYGQASQNYTPHPQQQTYGPASPQNAQQPSFGPPGQGERRNYVPQQNFGLPGQGERRDPAPRPGGTDTSQARDDTFTASYMEERRDPASRPGGTGASQAWDDTFTPSYVKDFKPSYMEEFERAEQGNHAAKEQTGSQQRYPPPGQGNFTGEGRY